MYEAINKLRNYRIIYANFIHEYGVNFHELYTYSFFFGRIMYLNIFHQFPVQSKIIVLPK